MKKTGFFIAAILLTCCFEASAGDPLGRYSVNPNGADSTANPYSPAGSHYSSKSITNPYGQYGSPYSLKSATNNPSLGGIAASKINMAKTTPLHAP